jgi:hypothetical protein
LLRQQLIWDVLKDLYEEVFILRSLGYELSCVHASPFFIGPSDLVESGHLENVHAFGCHVAEHEQAASCGAPRW